LIDAGTGAPSSAGGSSDLAFIRVAAGSFLIAAFAGAAFAGAAFGAFGAFDMVVTGRGVSAMLVCRAL
jgi:hypothetical protein